jgi:hypothetical protein
LGDFHILFVLTTECAEVVLFFTAEDTELGFHIALRTLCSLWLHLLLFISFTAEDAKVTELGLLIFVGFLLSA